MERGKVTVEIFDTTMRDGAQALHQTNQFAEGSKVAIAEQIAELGTVVIEAGFPATRGDNDEVRQVAETVGRETYVASVWANGKHSRTCERPVIVTGLSRAVRSDVEATWGAVEPAMSPRIHTFISTDPEHMAAKFPGKTQEQVLGMGVDAVRHAKELTSSNPMASVQFSAEAASTTNYMFLETVIKEAISAGADVINVPDTVGQRDPFWMQDFYGRVVDWVMKSNPNVTISAHNHNDLGNAVVNTLSLVRAARTYADKHKKAVKLQLETTVCGLGERAGNADVFPVVAGLFKFFEGFSSTPVEWRFNPERAVPVAKFVMGQAGMLVPNKSPVVGPETNVHRSGIHSDGTIKGGHRIYTPFDPTFWGHGSDAVHEDGKYQGRRGREAAKVAVVQI